MDKIFTAAADLSMSQVPGPAVQVGAIGQVTLAGTITQITAESLHTATPLSDNTLSALEKIKQYGEAELITAKS